MFFVAIGCRLAIEPKADTECNRVGRFDAEAIARRAGGRCEAPIDYLAQSNGLGSQYKSDDRANGPTV